MSRRAELGLMVVILLAAVALRFHRLDEIPPGLTHDEASVGFFTRQVYLGHPFKIDAPYGYANEPFTQYSAALLMHLLGPTDWTLRAHQAIWGVIAVLATFLWARTAFGARAGLIAPALVAVSYWPLATSRFALNNNPMPGLITGAVYFMWIGLFWKKASAARVDFRRWLAWFAFALCLAGSLYTYEAARAAWLAFPLFWAYLAVTRSDRRRLFEFGLALAFGAALAAPHLIDPAAWGRTNTLSTPLAAAGAGDLGPLLNNTLEGLGTLSLRGDPFIVYNLPGRPIFDPVTTVLFAIGLAYCLSRIRQPAPAFALLWFGAGLLPTLVIGAFTSVLHSNAAQTVTFIFPALGLASVAGLTERAASNGIRNSQFVILAALLAATAALTYRDYFHRWAEDPGMRAAYFANFGAVTAHLHRANYSGAVALSAPFPGQPHDPFAADLRVRRADLDLRWFDAREALVFPNADQSLLVLPVNALPDPLFAAHLPMHAATRRVVRADDVDPYFDTVVWNPRQTLQEWLTGGEVHRTAPPVNFGSAVELAGYSLDGEPFQPGTQIRLITFWHILDPQALGQRDLTEYGWRANTFVHLLGRDDQLVAQRDTLQAPAWNWHAGDWFVQIHRLDLPPELPAGEYRLTAGIYTFPDLVRLPTPTGDSADLGTITVVGP